MRANDEGEEVIYLVEREDWRVRKMVEIRWEVSVLEGFRWAEPLVDV